MPKLASWCYNGKHLIKSEMLQCNTLSDDVVGLCLHLVSDSIQCVGACLCVSVCLCLSVRVRLCTCARACVHACVCVRMCDCALLCTCLNGCVCMRITVTVVRAVKIRSASSGSTRLTTAWAGTLARLQVL